MPIFPVTPKKADALHARMMELNVRDEDIVETFIRSGGKGGQNVNKTSTCVYLKHLPTGLEVKCSRERVQGLNRYIARVMLLDKIEALIKGAESKKQQEIERIRRQKRKRSKRAKEKMLADKAHRSEQKRMRTKPDGNDAH